MSKRKGILEVEVEEESGLFNKEQLPP